MASFYGTIDYILLNRYVFNASVRSDGSNNFGSKEQFNATWSAGFSWNIDEESWMKGKISDVISSMTLRLATGYTGGVNKSVYPVIIMKYDNTFRISDTDSYRMGTISNAPNPHLSWEKTWDIKAGLDIGFFKDRLRLQVEAYNRKGYDLVTSSRVNSAVGFISQGYNTSEQVNRGVEFTLGATILRYKDFAWNFTANAAYNMNKLTKYVSPNSGIYGQYYVGYPQGMIITGKSTGHRSIDGILQLRTASRCENKRSRGLPEHAKLSFLCRYIDGSLDGRVQYVRSLQGAYAQYERCVFVERQSAERYRIPRILQFGE